MAGYGRTRGKRGGGCSEGRGGPNPDLLHGSVELAGEVEGPRHGHGHGGGVVDIDVDGHQGVVGGLVSPPRREGHLHPAGRAVLQQT